MLRYFVMQRSIRRRRWRRKADLAREDAGIAPASDSQVVDLLWFGVAVAAGVEPAPPQNANWLMARDFTSEPVGNTLPCCQLVVLWSALEFSGVLPSLGGMLETVSPTLLSRHRRSKD